MAAPGQRRGCSTRRRIFRILRALTLAAGLALLGVYLYLAEVGLPDFMEERVRAELTSHGLDLKFSRMRLRTFRQVVAEQVSLVRTSTPDGPSLTFREIVLRVRVQGWLPPRLSLAGVDFEAGRLVLPVPSAEAPAARLVADGISADLQFLPGDRWDLNHLEAQCLGARLRVDASLTNASAIAAWKPGPPAGSPPIPWEDHVRSLLEVSREFRFATPPDIRLLVSADARHPSEARLKLNVRANAAATSWGTLQALSLEAHLAGPPTSDRPAPCRLTLEVEGLRTRWATIRHGTLETRWDQSFSEPLPVRWDWTLALLDVVSPWGESPRVSGSGQTERAPADPTLLHSRVELTSARHLTGSSEVRTHRLSARMSHHPRSLIPLDADWEYVAEAPRGGTFGAERVAFSGTLRHPPSSSPPIADDTWGWWAALEPFEIDWRGEINRLALDQFGVESLTFRGRWAPPILHLDQLSASLSAGKLEGEGSLHVPSRVLAISLGSSFRPQELAPGLPGEAGRWFSQMKADEPVLLSARTLAEMPAWSMPAADWPAAALRALGVEAEVTSRGLSFRGARVTDLQARVAYTNETVRLLELAVGPAHSRLHLAATAHLPTTTLEASLTGRLDPAWLQSLCPPESRRVFGLCQFSEPLALEASFRGSWREPRDATVLVSVQATNFVVMDEPITELQATFGLAERQLSARQVRILTGPEWVHAEGLGFDPATQVLRLTNATAWIQPEKITRLLGANTARDLSPYRFLNPARALVNGWVNVANTHEADMNFHLSGGPFNYWRFNLNEVSTDIHWTFDAVTVTNLQAGFYGGAIAGGVFADLRPRPNAEVSFSFHVSNANLNPMMRDLQSPTNRLEGILSGDLTITRLVTSDWGSWQGHGQAYLKDGFLWDIPMFSVLTPVFNGIVPGIANSRATGGTATFIITNSLIVSNDVDIRSTAMRLAYRGSVDFEGRVDARAEARLLPDAFIVGPLVSLVFAPITKLLEFRVTGTLGQPKLELSRIPKPFLFPLYPLKGLEKLIEGTRGSPSPPPPATAPATAPAPPAQSGTSRSP